MSKGKKKKKKKVESVHTTSDRQKSVFIETAD
jgi:hypothetical protein